ncbi:MAG TPA: hypothetical protein VF638_14260 [Sphingomonas sp.]
MAKKPTTTAANIAAPPSADVTAIAAALTAMWDKDGFPLNVRDDAEAIAAVAWNAMQQQPRRAKEVRGSRNG